MSDKKINSNHELQTQLLSINKCIELVDHIISENDNHIMNWPQAEWEDAIIKWMESQGWVTDRNDETTLCFIYPSSNHEYKWMRDYNKKDRSFIQFNGNHNDV